MREQALALIEGVMDIDGEKIPVRKMLADYYARNSGSDTLRNLMTGRRGHKKKHRGTIARSFPCAFL